MNSLINYLDKYHSQLTVLLLGLSLIILAVFLWVWFYNRKKYHHLKHQIPASVVKNYLDSIIQNSTALKSSLFRGGGLEVDANGVPSVMPISELPSGAGVNVSSGEDDSALRAELARLQAQLNEKNSAIKDLENKNTEYSGDIKAKQERIEELEKLKAGLESKGDGDPEAAKKVEELSQEKEKLQDELKQFEIISDDLADLKRLKQENAQLKKALEESGGQVPEMEETPEVQEEPEAASEEEPESSAQEPESSEEEEASEEEVSAEVEASSEEEVEEPEADEEPMEEEPAAEKTPVEEEEEPAAEKTPVEEEKEPAAEEAEVEAAEASTDEEEDSETKSPEDLLSEFEKMLG